VVLIFGFGAGAPKDLGEVAPATCPNCHNEVFFHHVKSDKKFSLFFVPIMDYGTNEYLLCPICQHGLQLRPEQRMPVQQMQSRTQSYRHGQMTASYPQAAATFWRQLGVNPSGQQIVQPANQIPAAAAAPASSTATPADGPDTDRIAELAKLHAAGVLTDEEFAAAKKKLLGI